MGSPASAGETTRGLIQVGEAPAGASTDPLYRRQIALVVGVDTFEEPSLNLDYAVRDALGVARVLEERFGYEVRTLLNEEASREGVLTAISELTDLQPDDALLIFWAGHGTSVTTADGETLGYLVPWDGALEADAVLTRNLSMEEIRSVVGLAVPARHKLLVVDACYSGLLTRREATPLTEHDAAWLREMTRQPVFQVLTAGQADQSVLDGGPGGHSVFTGRLLAALEETEDYVTASELSARIQREVRADAWARGSHLQSPAYGRIAGTGDYVLVPEGGLDLAALPTRSLPTQSLPTEHEARTASPARGFVWGSAAALALGAAGLTTAAISYNQYQDSALTDGPQTDLYQLNRAAGVAGWSMVGVSGGLLGAALVVSR